MEYPSIFSKEFDDMVVAAGAAAHQESLRAGIPVSYLDPNTGIDTLEYPDGRKFEIRFIPGAPRDRNFEVLRELVTQAA